MVLSQKEHEKVLNISQDLMYNVTGAPMPKHVGLALYVLRQNRSKDLVTLLNRFGYSASYDDAQRYITAIAHLIDGQMEKDNVFIPTNLTKNEFVQCAFDNLDFSEDTRDGKTTHSTTHIIYQYSSTDLYHDRESKIPTKKRQKTTCNVDTFHTPESCLSLQDRRKARSVRGTLSSQYNTELNATSFILNDDNFVWCLSRIYRQKHNMTSLSWNEFFSIFNDSKPSTVIAYGPVFPESPTKPDVVQASVDYFIALTQNLGQDVTVVTCDQAIYDIVKGFTTKYKYFHCNTNV